MISDSSVAVIIFIILLSFFIVFISEAWADHEYFEPYIHWEQERPIICVIGVEGKYKYYTLRAIKSWELAFRDYTGTDKYDYRILMGDVWPRECNVLFTTSNVTMAFVSTDPVGTTTCYSSLSMCQVIIQTAFQDGKYYYDTVVHEIGHVMGVGHRLANDFNGFRANVLSDDVMIPTVKPFVHITKESLDAIIYFDEIFPFAGNYTIPHNDTWADKDG